MGAHVVAGGGAPQGDEYAHGHFIQLIVLANVKPHLRAAQEEIFGPVISVLEAGDAQEALRLRMMWLTTCRLQCSPTICRKRFVLWSKPKRGC